MTITITHPQTASRRARYAAIAVLIAVAATMIGYWGVQTMTDDPATTITTPTDLDVSAPLADWARTTGVAGLSPASATAPPISACPLNLPTGPVPPVSPGSRPPAPPPRRPRRVRSTCGLGPYHGVAGLSPASASATTPA